MGQSAIVDLLLVKRLESSHDGRLAERMVHGPSASHGQVKIPAVGTTGCHSPHCWQQWHCCLPARAVRIVGIGCHTECHRFGTGERYASGADSLGIEMNGGVKLLISDSEKCSLFLHGTVSRIHDWTCFRHEYMKRKPKPTAHFLNSLMLVHITLLLSKQHYILWTR